MKKYISILLAIVLSVPVFGQNTITIKGTVYDETGAPMIGAGVTEKGTTNGTVTDHDGMYTLNVKSDAQLHISYISYTTQTVDVAGRGVVDVTLEPDKNILNEVVVIGCAKDASS